MKNQLRTLALRCGAITAVVVFLALAPTAQANSTAVLCVGRGGAAQHRSVLPCLKGQKKISLPTAPQALPAYYADCFQTNLNIDATATTVATLTVPAGSCVASFTTFSDTYLVSDVASSRLTCSVYNGVDALVRGYPVDPPNLKVQLRHYGCLYFTNQCRAGCALPC